LDSCAFNGVDTIITQGGHHVFQKNQGGTNNWGENTSVNLSTLSGGSAAYPYAQSWDASDIGIYKYTKDYLVRTGMFSGASLSTHEFQVLDHDFNPITSPISLADGTAADSRRVSAIEASRDHNYVGVMQEVGFNFTDNFITKLFYLL